MDWDKALQALKIGRDIVYGVAIVVGLWHGFITQDAFNQWTAAYLHGTVSKPPTP